MRYIKHLVAFIMVFFLAGAVSSAPLFVDSFESGDMSATNEFGFDWGRNNKTSVVTVEAVVYNNGEKSVAIPSGRNWEPKHEKHSLRFRYGAGKNMTEQRFHLGSAHPEIWYKYWIRVPINYSHASGSPSNNKFFATWMDGYSKDGDGPTVYWNLLGNGESGSNIAVSHSTGGYTIAGGQMDSTPFISVPDDRGRWMEVVIHITASTSTTEGLIEFWRRWESESTYTKIHEVEGANLPIPSGGPEGWNNGYIMGWANAPYSRDTEWLLDHFQVSTSPLLDIGSSLQPDRPMPPELSID